MSNFKHQTIWTADNLDVMRGMNSERVDLIYLDPPFNSNADYAAPVGSKAAGAAFKDTWTKDDIDDAWLDLIKSEYPGLWKVLDAVEDIHGASMQSYLIYMAPRLMEMRRLLRSTGSIYLHCDPTASHYLKLMMDTIFGRRNYQNEISWKRCNVHCTATSTFDRITDNILVYTKSHKEALFNVIYGPVSDDELRAKFPHKESETGRRYQHIALENSSGTKGSRVINGETVTSEMGWRWGQEKIDEETAKNPHLIYWTGKGKPRYKIYADEYKGMPIGNNWTDIKPLSTGAKERTGYPTQKPLALLRRIILASSNPGDMVLDPFCGCATACIAAEGEGRQWVGIDIAEKAAELVQSRMRDEMGQLLFEPIHRRDIPKRTDVTPAGKYNSPANKGKLYGRQGGHCGGCGDHFLVRHLEVDHVVPRKKGGGDHLENLQLLCGSCNRTKGDRTQEYLKARLKERGWLQEARQQQIDSFPIDEVMKNNTRGE